MDQRTALRRLGQANLGQWIEVATGEELWGKQREIAEALSQPFAQVVVPSCNASGKTWLAARLALAFFDAYTPGTPCEYCDPTGTTGGCRGAKVITTSSKKEHLLDNLWGEIRLAYPKAEARVGVPGELMPAAAGLNHEPNHFITGMVATKAEGFQGYHAAHILIIGDEATSVSEEVAQGIIGLLASGDARLLLILNPTDTTTYAYQKSKAPGVKVIKIDAYSTPNFTGEPMPDGAHLIHPGFLWDLQNSGMGPGTYEWTTRVLAEFWNIGEDTLVAEPWYDRAVELGLWVPSTRSLGIDIASYGTAESVIALRDGNTIAEIRAFPAGRVDHFFEGPVTKAVREFRPDYVVYDADGVGAGAIGSAEKLGKHLKQGAQIIGFRGAKRINDAYTNSRAAWYWTLRKLFEAEAINVNVNDPKFREQITQIRYSIVQGAIRVESKEEMRKRGMASPDRADAVMYSFAFAADLPVVHSVPQRSWVEENFDLKSAEDRMWRRERSPYDEEELHPLLGVWDW